MEISATYLFTIRKSAPSFLRSDNFHAGRGKVELSIGIHGKGGDSKCVRLGRIHLDLIVGRFDSHQIVQIDLPWTFRRKFDIDQLFDFVVNFVDNGGGGFFKTGAVLGADGSSLHTWSDGLEQ
jgi:hypothetical protein